MIYCVLKCNSLQMQAPLLGGNLPEIIEDEYIVVFDSIDRVSNGKGENS